MLIHDLAVVLLCAVAIRMLFYFLHLPVLVGYIMGGMLLGPNLLDFSPIKNLASIQELSELGVIFLMFHIGLEFDLEKLKRILGPSFIAVVLQTLVLVFVALQTAPLLGLNRMDGLFLGALLSIASSMVVFSVVRERGELNKPYAHLAIGVLILEDILAIILLVVLNGVAVAGHWEWKSAWQSTFLVGVFVVMVYFLGKLIAPWLLRIVARIGSSEVIAIFAVALVLGVSLLAEQLHFSLALGAFLAGAILAQSSLVEAIEKAIEPLNNLFTAVFFIAIGMLLQPKLLLGVWPTVLLISVIKILGTTAACSLGLFLSGQKARPSFKAAVVKSQIGEFSFVIVALGQRLKVTDPSLMTITGGVALLTILVTPFLASRATNIYEFLEKRCPENLKLLGQFYHNVLGRLQAQVGRHAFLKLAKRPMLQILFYFFVLAGILIIASNASVFISNHEDLNNYVTPLHAGTWLVAALIGLPFLVAVIRNFNAIIMIASELALSGLSGSFLNQGRVRNLFNTIVLSLTLALAGSIFVSIAAPYFPQGLPLLISFIVLLAAILFFWRDMVRFNSHIEYRFMESFNQQSRSMQDEQRKRALETLSKAYPWPITISECTIEADSPACGETIASLQLRERSGAVVIGIGRGQRTVYGPSPETVLFESDRVTLFGNESQNQKAQSFLLQKIANPAEKTIAQDPTLERVYLESNAAFVGESLAGLQLRKRYGVHVLGIQRGEERITTPAAQEVLHAHDVLFVLGTAQALTAFQIGAAGGKGSNPS